MMMQVIPRTYLQSVCSSLRQLCGFQARDFRDTNILFHYLFNHKNYESMTNPPFGFCRGLYKALSYLVS
jgi:hypothetical protein